MKIGDMMITGRHPPPGKLLKALSILSAHMHPLYDAAGFTVPGKSKESCVLVSATAREFFYRIGFKDADFRAVAVVIWAERDGIRQHSLGIGNPGPTPNHKADRWDGHAIVTVGGFLVDLTLWQGIRPQWPTLPPMMAVELEPPGGEKLWNRDVLAWRTGVDSGSGNEVAIGWLATPDRDEWRKAPDYVNKHERRKVADQLVALFGNWNPVDDPRPEG